MIKQNNLLLIPLILLKIDKTYFMRIIFLSAILSLLSFTLTGQNPKQFTISGFVKEAVSSESLIGVNVYLPDLKTGTTTNNFGFYSITIPKSDSINLAVSYIGYNTEIIRIGLSEDVELNIEMKPNNILQEVIVSADRQEKQSERVQMSTLKLPVEQIKNVPALLGEKDVLKVLQLMPGVQKGFEGSSGLYVRGGGPDQNLIILDDAIVYNASHLFGFFSLFNADALKSVELTKGGFPARYGGRLSSVLEMNMKEGNKEEWHSEGGIGLISSRLTVEGPLKKGKSSILLSGRRTYADLLVYPFLKGDKVGYYFYDFNAKINYDFGRNNKLYLSGYFGQDKFSLKTKNTERTDNAGFYWGNSTATLRWNHLFNNKLFSNTSAIYSNYNFGLYDKFKVLADSSGYTAEFNSGIRDLTLKYDIDYLPSPKHWIKAGAISIFHRFNPYAYVEDDKTNNKQIRDIKNTDGLESGLYLEDTWQPLQALKVNAGLRFSHFLTTKNQYHFFEPRLSVAWRLKNDLALKGSYASMNQFIHLISNTGVSLPTDLWVPTTSRIRPQQSQQVALGFVKDFSNHDLSFSLEGYYKKMKNVLTYKEGASFITIDDPSEASSINWENNVTAGRAWSYGLEFLLQKKTGRLTGWIGYTLSWTQMQFDSVNSGRKYFARYDRRHDISLVAIYKLNDHITLSGTWVYGTGNAVTLPTSQFSIVERLPGSYITPDNYNTRTISNFFNMGSFNDLGEKNNFRMAPYHRLDLGIQFQKKKKWGDRTWEISVYNAYNRQNPFFYYNDTKSTPGMFFAKLKQVSLFPVIPSVTYSFKF
jgi:hypothetical protein